MNTAKRTSYKNKTPAKTDSISASATTAASTSDNPFGIA